MTTRGTSNTNSRGSSYTRRRRRAWLLLTFDPDLGPDLARCQLHCSDECLRVVDDSTISADRFPVPGCDGGTYVRGNIRPACMPCQSKHGGALRSTKIETVGGKL